MAQSLDSTKHQFNDQNCVDCDRILSSECVSCERRHPMLKALEDPMASKTLMRWMEGSLGAIR
jgi:hypothetical protein